jgi:hypothetical protein
MRKGRCSLRGFTQRHDPKLCPSALAATTLPRFRYDYSRGSEGCPYSGTYGTPPAEIRLTSMNMNCGIARATVGGISKISKKSKTTAPHRQPGGTCACRSPVLPVLGLIARPQPIGTLLNTVPFNRPSKGSNDLIQSSICVGKSRNLT